MSTAWIIFALVAAAFAVTTRGRLTQGVDSIWYVRLSDAIMNGSLRDFATTHQANFTILGFTSVLAAVRMASPTHWELIMLALNIACAAVTAVLLMKIVRMVTASIGAAIVALLLYISCWDVFVWVRWLLTDTIYTTVATAVFLVVGQGIVGVEVRYRRLKLALLVAAAVIMRPVGVVLIPLVVLTEWSLVPPVQSWRRRTLWLLVATGILVAVVGHAYLFQDMRRWPSDYLRPKLAEYAAREQRGEVVWGRPETFHRPPVTMLDHLSIEADRFVRYFQITMSQYSPLHNTVAIAYFVPLYVLALIGVVDALRGRGGRRAVLVEAALLWVISMDALSAVTVLDFDFRYRLPLMPQIILMAACGADALLRRFRVAEPQAVPVT